MPMFLQSLQQNTKRGIIPQHVLSHQYWWHLSQVQMSQMWLMPFTNTEAKVLNKLLETTSPPAMYWKIQHATAMWAILRVEDQISIWKSSSITYQISRLCWLEFCSCNASKSYLGRRTLIKKNIFIILPVGSFMGHIFDQLIHVGGLRVLWVAWPGTGRAGCYKKAGCYWHDS